MFRKMKILPEFAGYFAVASLAGLLVASSSHGAAEPKVIELTQIPCQFIESENGIDRGYTTTEKADCDAINARTGAERVASSFPSSPGRASAACRARP